MTEPFQQLILDNDKKNGARYKRYYLRILKNGPLVFENVGT